MILADSSVWIDHLRRGEPDLAVRLERGAILCHAFIIGELALGGLRDRGATLSALRELPMAVAAADEEVLDLIERRRLHGRGLGFVDVHLLAATLLTSGATLWTRDRRLHEAAGDFGVAQP